MPKKGLRSSFDPGVIPHFNRMLGSSSRCWKKFHSFRNQNASSPKTEVCMLYPYPQRRPSRFLHLHQCIFVLTYCQIFCFLFLFLKAMSLNAFFARKYSRCQKSNGSKRLPKPKVTGLTGNVTFATLLTGLARITLWMTLAEPRGA